MRLAGEIADGLLLNWCTPERVRFARERVAEGAEAAGRDPRAIGVAVYVRAWAGQDEAAGLAAFRAAAGEYATYPSYARQFAELGLAAEAEAAAAAHRAGKPQDVPVGLVEAIGALGEGAAAKVAAYVEAGADVPIVYPVTSGEPAASIEATLSALAPG
jgi:alkanesulfonate monooxygenase SsuD/methylene tetrahydromethanopterin reductase-like flavin-dependent oxidoreductase (luciferase family)